MALFLGFWRRFYEFGGGHDALFARVVPRPARLLACFFGDFRHVGAHLIECSKMTYLSILLQSQSSIMIASNNATRFPKIMNMHP